MYAIPKAEACKPTYTHQPISSNKLELTPFGTVLKPL
jgi:hypothetical protein